MLLTVEVEAAFKQNTRQGKDRERAQEDKITEIVQLEVQHQAFYTHFLIEAAAGQCS